MLIVAVVIAAIGIVTYLNRSTEPQGELVSKVKRSTQPVRTEVVAPRTLDETVTHTATLAAVRDVTLSAEVFNRAKEEGLDPEEAIVQAGCLRLRPIILTSLTTIAGLLPMEMGLGGTSLTWSPLANTIVWGLGVGTLLTLFLIPAVYLLLVHDLRRGLGRLFRRKQPR